MKKTFTLISLLSMLGSVAFGATEFKISSMQTQETSCAVTVPYTVYGGKSPERALYDALQGDKNIHFKINFEESFGRYYNPYNVLRFPSDARLGFRYRSHIKPAGENEVVVLAQGSGMKTNFAIPTAVNGVMPNRNTVAGQFVFTIVRQQQGNGKGTAQEYKYMPTTPTPWVQKSTTLTTLFNGQTYKDNECLNIYVGRCGDGIVDNGNNAIIDGHSTSNGQLAGGETCDEGSLNGTAGHCNISCSGTGIVPSTGGLILTKSLVTSKTYLSGETVEFRVDFKNNGTTQADFVILQDVLPYSVEYISSEIYGVTATSGKYTQNGSLVVEYSGFNLQPGQAGYMLIRGKVLVPACSTSKTNFAFLYANKDNKPLSAQADYTCSNAATPDPICKNITTNTTTNGKDIHVLCLGDYTNTNTPMIIDCGSSAQTQYHQSTADTLGKYSATCSYSSVSKAKESKISCKVANSTCNTTIGACTLDANAHVAIVGDEGNGKIKYTCETKDGSEQALQILCGNEDNDKSDEEVDSKITHTCTYTEEDYKKAGDDKTLQAKCIVDGDASCSVDTVIDKGVLSYCGNGIREGYEECDGGGEYGEGEWKGQMCKEGCTLCDECHDEVTQCLSIDNGNVSVQKDEILPFWWKMYKPAYIVEEKTCDNKSQAGNIKRSSMRCTFSLRQPGEPKAIDILDDVDCDKQQITNQALFSNFYQSSRSKSFGTWFLKLDDVLDSSKFEDNVFGEYKLRLHKVKYDYCACDDDGDCEWKKTQINNICETNFTITRPYLIQKSAFGTSPRATDAKLSNFFDILGNPLIKKTDLEDVMILDEKAYTSKTDAKFMIVSEAAQIAKLAVTMNKAQLPAALQNTNITVKKVPNKAIYLLEAKNKSTYTINVQDDSLNKVPFTIITKNIDLVINGSMNTNGLFVTQNGTINFRQSLDLCAAPQVVKGIFVAGNGFTTSKIENSNLNQNWCQYGNLHVKGILVGAGIDNLVENRRSNLNNWFNVSGSEKSIKVQRRNQIFNGASLMIEYNPDLWKTLPPGAEQFVNLLDVYKK